MAKLTYAQKQRVNRRNADIFRLQEQYQRSVEDYGAKIGPKEQAFKAEMEKYDALYKPYAERANAYKSRLDAYMEKINAYRNTPETFVARNVVYGPSYLNGGYIPYNAKGPGERQAMPANARFVASGEYGVNSPQVGNIVTRGGLPDPGSFTEKFEEQAPLAPAGLDISQEKAKLQLDKDYTEREVNERSKARLRAVQRGNARPMLSSGTNISKA